MFFNFLSNSICEVNCFNLGCLISLLVIFVLTKYDWITVIISPKVEPDSDQHGGQLVANVLKAHNVTHLFTLIGGHISPIVVSAEKCGIRVIDTRHEVTAVFAADAFARLSGTVGVAAVTAGPGLTNTITAVKNAQMAETPLLLIGGAAATLLKGRGALQDIDQLGLFKSLCKYVKTVTCVRHIIPVLCKAIQEAQSGVPGPVFVELPIDVLYPYKMVRQEMKLKSNPHTIMEKISNLYLKSYLHYQFASAFVPKEVTPLPVHFPLASDSEIHKSCDLISKSKRPVMLLGSQALIPPNMSEHLKASLETLGIPCYLSGMSRGLLGKKHELHIRQKRREALKEADLVILAGAVCDFRLSYGRVLNAKSKIIAVNRDKSQLYKNSGIFWKPSVAIHSSIPHFILKLAKNLKHFSFESNWLSILQERDAATEEKYRQDAKMGSSLLNPIHLLYELESALPNNTILIADGGDFVASASYILRARGPLQWLDPGAFGTLGVGAGFALGAKLCKPDADVFILYGDGSSGYSIMEFDTFIRHKLPIAAVIGNDACWTQIAREQVPLFQSDIGCKLAFTDYHKIVEAIGGKGILLSAEHNQHLLSKFKEVVQLLHKGNCVLVNAHIGKTDFRAGSISI